MAEVDIIRNSVYNGVISLGFRMFTRDSDTEPGVERARFEKAPSGKSPALEIVIVGSRAGYHVMANSTPFDNKYHMHTDDPVKPNELICTLCEYLDRVSGRAPQSSRR